MRWEIKAKLKTKTHSKRREEIVKVLLKNRNILDKKSINEFLNPPEPETLEPSKLGINAQELKKTNSRIHKAIKKKENIVVYGDYDADGICSTAILWETLHALGAKVSPFIPHREKHGYGLSIKGIKEIISFPQHDTQKVYPKRLSRAKSRESQKSLPSLIITVDNGIVAYDAVKFANKNGIDIIICDHHQKSKRLPKACAIIHTDELAGAGVTWIFAKELLENLSPTDNQNKKPGLSKSTNLQKSRIINNTLDLAAIGTIADMVPLIGANRSIAKYGLSKLRKTKRMGLLELFTEAFINPEIVDTYHINFLIAPRLNAMGRLEHAIDSLRLLCTKSQDRAKNLASTLGSTNRQRQQLTDQAVLKAKQLFELGFSKEKKLIIIEHTDFHEGIIGLIAGKLVEEYYRPTIVIAKGEEYSKASARSIPGFNIIEAIRQTEEYLVDAGGHPMAAGFSIQTKKITSFKKSIQEFANRTIDQQTLEKKITIDCEITLVDISWQLFKSIQKFEPFGIANPMPIFTLRDVRILESRAIGSEGKHLKIFLPTKIKTQPTIQALWFGKGEIAYQLPNKISLAFTLDENVWNNQKELQLKIKDINKNR